MDKNRIAQSVIVGLAAVMAAASWVGLKNFLFGDGGWIFPTIGFLVLLVFLSINCLLTSSKINLLITLAFVLVSFLFSFGINLSYLAVLFAVFLLFVFGFAQAVNEKKNRIKIQIVQILRKGLPPVLTGLALIIAAVYYFSPLAAQKQAEIEIPRPLFDMISQPLIDMAQDASLDNDMEIGDALYEAINQGISRYSRDYGQYIPLGMAFGVFFAVKALGFLFMWLVILLSWAIFKLLIASGAIKVREKAVLQEVIET